MAKRAPKETSLPLVISLVFFVLTTIAFGVMWYMQYSDQQAKDEAVKKAAAEKTAAQGQEADAVRKLRIARIFLGVAEDEDKSAIEAETSGKDKVGAEVKRIREVLAKQFPGGVPSEVDIWKIDEKGLPEATPKTGIITAVGQQALAREAAEKEAAKERAKSKDAIAQLDKVAETLKKATADFSNLSVALPKDFKAKLDDIQKKYDERKAEFAVQQKQERDKNVALEDENIRANRAAKQLKDQLDEVQKQLVENTVKLLAKRDAFQFDEPQGKITRRLPEGIVEINIGSNAHVREGLTFTVLPSDFPEKGRQSRMFKIRVPNERGEYKDETRFVEKATIEVIEVLGPELSRARITSEAQQYRDSAGAGDLLYNSVWRKGSSDHVALVGVFDINGDGTDDVQNVVRDLSRMGVVVDAYFDLTKRKWVGNINEQTRYLIVGRYPVQSANDPNREEKTKLIDAISKAIDGARQKGIQDVQYRDFFPRMGYRVKIDVSDDKINQATAPFLKGVATSDMPPPDGN
jgi:hypothetical protein